MTIQTDLENKQKILLQLREHLKTEFVGIDTIIDQLVDSIETWYIFPEIQIRPTIICLWGLTGVGKTNLVRKMVKFLKLQEKFVEIEMTNVSTENKTIEDRLSISSIDNNEQGILLLDEFQNFRTVQRDGSTTISNSYSDVWTLLSDGCFQPRPTITRDVISRALNYKYDAEWKTTQSNTHENAIYKRSYESAMSLKYIFKLPGTAEDVMKLDYEQILELYNTHNLTIYEGNCYKKLLIIIAGNLDEAYSMSDHVDEVDLDADFYHEYSKKITILDIKKALTKRFKPEQIARFGNTQLLYPCLSKQNYYEIIVNKCNEINGLIKSSHNINITYDNSVYDIIYKNGVFPTQGVRPLLSTLTNILSVALPKFVYECLISNVDKINITYQNNSLCTTIASNNINVSVPTMLETIRENIDEDTKYIVSVHELGHAIIYSLLFNTVPAQICTNSISSYNNGFILQHYMVINKENINSMLAVSMAGRAAEEMVYGESSSSIGAEHDIKIATSNAWNYIGKYGFDGINGLSTTDSRGSDGKILVNNEIKTTIENLIKDAKDVAKDLLHTNIKFYKYLLKYLIENDNITPLKYKEISKEFGFNFNIIDTGKNLSLGYKKATYKFLQ